MSRPMTSSASHKSKTLNNKYMLGEEIGKGAYGKVYKGLDLENGDFVAVKQVSLENVGQMELNVIMQEIELLKNLHHKNIVKYLGSMKTKSHLHIILEFVENGSLANIIRPNKFGPFPESLAAVYIAQVLEGLVYLHEQGVIHRDIKGANILTTKEGLVKLADFGVATKLPDANLNSHTVAGTPYWMAPEAIEMSGVCAASDIWSVGCTVIELLTCRPPYFDLQPMTALYRIVQDEQPPIPDNLSPALTDFLRQCFKKDSRQRPDAKTLLSHPWIQNSRRGLQTSLCHSGTLRNIKEVVSVDVELSKSEQGQRVETSSTEKESKTGLLSSAHTGVNAKITNQMTNELEADQVPTFSFATSPRQTSALTNNHDKQAELEPHESAQNIKDQSRRKAVRVSFNSERSELNRFSDQPSDASLDDLFYPRNDRAAEDSTSSSLSHANRGNNGGKNDLAAKLRATIAQKQMENASLQANGGGDLLRLIDIDTLGFEDKLHGENLFQLQAVEFSKLVSSLRLDEPEDVIVSACQKLTTFFHQRPDQKIVFITQHGLVPLVELLEVPRTRVICSVLQVLNQIIKDNTDFQEIACLVGLIPAVMRFATPDRPMEIRIEAAYFLQQLCESSSFTLQMFVACRGIPILVGFLEADYAKYSEMVHMAIDGMWQILKLRKSASRNDFCRMAAKNGILLRLINALYSLNEAARLSSSSGLASHSASDVLSCSGALNARPGSSISSGLPSHMVSPWNVDVAREYLEKVADLLLEFAAADSEVKSFMCSQSFLRRLFQMFNKIKPTILLKLLKCINHLSTDPCCLPHLQRADAIGNLIPNLDLKEGPHVPQIHHEALNALFNLCKINKKRQEQAAENGIIPHLLEFIMSDSPLRQYALPLLCDMAHASRKSREQLRAHGALDMYLRLLEDEIWCVTALDSVAVCLAHDNEKKKVEQALLKKDAVQRLIKFFQCCPELHFLHILEPFLKIIRRSPRINTTLAVNGLTPLLITRLDNPDAIARLNLLRLIKAVYEHHPRPKQLIVENNLPEKLEYLIQERRDGMSFGGQVLVKQMATSLLKTLYITTVL